MTSVFFPQPVQTLEEPQAEYHRELTEEDQLEAILNDPLLADIEDDADLGLLTYPNICANVLKRVRSRLCRQTSPVRRLR